jgi:hypothetical protein
VREAHPDRWTENDLESICRHEHAILDRIADWHLHPAIAAHDPERRERGAQCDHCGRKQAEPARRSGTAEQQNAEEAGLQSEGGEGLITREALPGSVQTSAIVRSVGAELEGHDNSGRDAEIEWDTENLQPELENQRVGRPASRDVRSFGDCEPRGRTSRGSSPDQFSCVHGGETRASSAVSCFTGTVSISKAIAEISRPSPLSSFPSVSRSNFARTWSHDIGVEWKPSKTDFSP